MMNSTLRMEGVRRQVIKAHVHAQRGVVLIIALIVLVAMTLGGIAIMRSVDTATLIAGNIAFKQRTLQGADLGIETAIKWLSTNSSSLTIDNTTNGYYSSVNPDPMQRFAWELISSWTTAKFVGTDVSGNTVQYVIHRMCTLPGQPTNATGQLCGTSSMSGSTTSLAGPSEGASFAAGASVFATAPQTYYRVIVRSTGPRNAVSYVQAMVLI